MQKRSLINPHRLLMSVALTCACLCLWACSEEADRSQPDDKGATVPVVRTDFADDAQWKKLQAAIDQPQGMMQAVVFYIDDPSYKDNDPVKVSEKLKAERSYLRFLFIADSVTFANKDMPILVVDLSDEPKEFFRVIPSKMWAVQNNLELANMDWSDFADHTDQDGIFRGSPKP